MSQVGSAAACWRGTGTSGDEQSNIERWLVVFSKKYMVCGGLGCVSLPLKKHRGGKIVSLGIPFIASVSPTAVSCSHEGTVVCPHGDTHTPTLSAQGETLPFFSSL